MAPTLRQLRYFEALAAQGHFGRAAALSAVSQPALSVQIRELEAALGAPLFERGPRAVRLTALGEALAPRVRRILSEVDELSDLARASGGRLAGRLRLGVIPTIAPYLLPRLMERLGRDHPDVDLHLRETTTPRLLRELAEGRLDAALLALPVGAQGLASAPLFSERFLLVRPAAEAEAPVPRREELAGMRLLLLEEGHCLRDQALSFCRIGDGPREGLDGSSLSTLVQMVGAGMGATLIPEMAVAVETRSAAVAVTPLAEPQPERLIGLVWRRSSPLGAQMAELGEVVTAAAKAGQGSPIAASERHVAAH